MRLVLLALLVLHVQGCVLAPFIESFREAGATSSDRERLFGKDVKRFNDARFWGNAQVALAYTEESARKEMRDRLSESQDKEKIVESKLTAVDFAEDSYTAQAAIKVKYYRIPYYIVEERVENQTWRFSIADGWRIVSISDAA